MNIRDEKGDVRIDTTEIQSIIRYFYEQLYTNSLEKPIRNTQISGYIKLPQTKQ
jgi:hypothetical protein